MTRFPLGLALSPSSGKPIPLGEGARHCDGRKPENRGLWRGCTGPGRAFLKEEAPELDGQGGQTYWAEGAAVQRLRCDSPTGVWESPEAGGRVGGAGGVCWRDLEQEQWAAVGTLL